MTHEVFATMREAVEAVRGVWPVEVMPGELVRFDDREGRRRNRAGWISLTADSEIAVAGNWRAPELRALYVKNYKGRKLTRAEKRKLDAQIQEARRKAEAERAAEWSRAAAVAGVIALSARSAVEVGHSYLTRKHVRPAAPLGVIDADVVRSIYQRMTGEDASWLWSYKLERPMQGPLLVVPCYLGDFTDRLSSVELIDGAGSKVSLRGGRMSGAFWTPDGLIEAAKSGSRIGIAEGIATALSISQVKGFPCVAARSCVNLEATAKALKNRFPTATLIVCADRGNGEFQARKAAIATGAGFMRPPFNPTLVAAFKAKTGSDKPTDFNDFFIATGDI